MQGQIMIPAGTKEVLFLVQNGSLRVNPGTERAVVYHGGLRRNADNQALLAQIEAIPPVFTAVQDPENPARLVVRAPLVAKELVGRAFIAIETEVALPPELAVVVEVEGSGHLEATGREAPLRMATQRGDLRVMQCHGPTKVRTGQGMTIIYDHCGDLDVEVRGGDIQAFVRQPGSRLRLVTGQGNVQCHVPQETGFRLDGRTQTGKVANGFGIPLERNDYTSTMVGERGDARCQIVLRTETGFLSLSHKKFE
jgi:hypothetical protein